MDGQWTQMRTGQGHGQQAGQLRVYFALKPRPLRGHQDLENCKGRMDSKNIDLDDLLTPAQFGQWIGESESWVRRRMSSIPGIIREGRKHIRIHPRTYLEKRLKIGPNPSSRHSW
jgi:hypothetical protein